MAVATLSQQDVERLAREWEQAFNGGDAAAVASFYAEDARMLPPGGPMIQGRQGIEQFFRSLRDDLGVKEIQLHVQTVESSGDLAYDVGTATLRIHPPDGEPITDPGNKYVVVWKRQADGAWRIAVDIFNSDNPA